MTTVLFGVGHPDRGDDAAGWLVADRLEDCVALTVRRVAADPSALLSDPLWNDADQVVIVDTVVTGAEPGTIHCWDLSALFDTTTPTAGGTHDLGIAATMCLARALDRLPSDATIIGIEGRSFEFGAPPSPEVHAAAERLAAALGTGLAGLPELKVR